MVKLHLDVLAIIGLHHGDCDNIGCLAGTVIVKNDGIAWLPLQSFNDLELNGVSSSRVALRLLREVDPCPVPGGQAFSRKGR